MATMTSITPEKVAERIRIQAAKANVSYTTLAKRVGVSANAMNEIVNGRNFPRVRTLVALAMEFQVSTDYLLGLSDEEG